MKSIKNKLPSLPSTFVNSTRQSGIETLEHYRKGDKAVMYLAEVINTYSERCTCDIKSLKTGAKQRDIPLVTQGGLVNDEIYGEIDLPAVGAIVLVDFIEGRETMPIIVGSILPFLNPEYGSNQTAVNSSGKVYTTELLEKDKPNTYKKIFQNGTTIEVQEDGSYILETPSGTYIKIDEGSSGDITIEANGNTFSMESGKVVINGNLEVDQ